MPTETTYSSLRQNLASVLDNVVDYNETWIVKRAKRGDVALVPAHEWRSMQETMHLLSSPANAQRLRQAREEIEQGQSMRMTLDELRTRVGLPAAAAKERSRRTRARRGQR